MVLCKYFLQGTCRFGNKCHNDHFDIKQLLKADADGAVNGKQWPFSCYGPFKDKKCIPNFVEDQSFEEIRFMCYEAKQKNYFDQFHQQFTKEALEATNKLRIIAQSPADVVELAIKIYDSVPETNAISNPFGSNIFNKTNTTSTAGGIFGGNNNTYQSPQNIFASSANQLQQQQQNIFNSANNSQVAGNIFGGNVNSPPASNIFGPTIQTQQTSVFAQTNNQQGQSFPFANNTVQSGGSIFGQSTNANIASPFSQQPNTAVTATNSPQGIFSQALQQRSPQQSLFNPFQNAAVQSPFAASNANTGNIFQQNQASQQMVQQQQPQQAMLQTTQNGGLFNQNIGGIPGQVVGAQPNAAINFTSFNRFPSQPEQQQQPQNIFQQQNPAPLFPFQTEQQQQQQLLQQQAFQQQQQLQLQQQQQQQLFQQQTLEAQAQQQQQQQQHQQLQQQQQQGGTTLPTANDSRYSQMESVNEEDLEKFNAKFFGPNGVPICLPPRELC